MKFLNLLLLFAVQSLSASEIAYYGNIKGIWGKFLGSDYSIISIDDTGKFNFEKLKKYPVVIISRIGASKNNLTADDLSGIREYLKNGGVIYTDSASITSFSSTDNVYDLSSASDIIGAARYAYGEVRPLSIMAENVLTKEIGREKAEKFFSGRIPSLANVRDGKILMGTDGNAYFMVNRYGKGLFVYFSNSVRAMEKETDVSTEMKEMILELFKMISEGKKENLDMICKESPNNNIFKIGAKQFNLEFAKDGNAKAKSFFAEMMEKITGRKSGNYIGSDSITVHIGETEYVKNLGLDFEKLHYYGYYIIFRDGRNLVLAGANERATEYAVNDFLKRFCGYRLFYSKPLGTIIPKKNNIELPEKIEIKEEPDILSYVVAGGEVNNFARNGRALSIATHAFHKMLSPGKYGKEHPEYFCMINGKRFIPGEKTSGTWQPCLNNPDLVKLASIYAGEYFTKRPEQLSVPSGVNDGGGDCQCPECLELVKKYKNRYVPFYNQFARDLAVKHPGKLLAFIAYGRCDSVPENIRLEPNILVEICSGLRNNMDEMKKWKAAGAKNIGLYDYLYTFGGGYAVPRYYPHIIGNAWKNAFKEYNLKSIWEELYPRTMLFEAPRQYVLNELAWNMNSDIDALLDDYFSNMYSEAAKPVKEFFTRFEEIYGRRKNLFHPSNDWKNMSQFEDYTFDDIGYLDAKLSDAGGSVKNPDASKRIELLKKAYSLSKLYVNAYLYAGKLEKITGISSMKEIDEIIKDAELASASVKGIDDFSLSAEEEKELFNKKDGLAEFKKQTYIYPLPLVENKIDNAFNKITEYLLKTKSWDEIRNFWLSNAAKSENSYLKSFILTQVYIHENKVENLVANSGFEPLSEADEIELQFASTDWEKISKKLKGWASWHFQQSVTDFIWDDKEAHSGKYSLAIGENQIAGSLLTSLKMEPDCRYKLSFWVKRKTNEGLNDGVFGSKPPAMSVRFKDKKGTWADNGSSVTAEYPKSCIGKWEKVELTFSSPPNTAVAMPLFSAPHQGPECRIWFDDVSITKIYDPAYFKDAKKVETGKNEIR